jgi:putative membrane protein
MPLFGPFPKPAWFGSAAQLAYAVAVRVTGALLANLFVWSGTVFYGWYGDLGDQSAAGAVMMAEESVVMVALFGWLVLRWMRDAGERQELVELASARGLALDEHRVARAVAAGRGGELRRRLEAGGGRPLPPVVRSGEPTG